MPDNATVGLNTVAADELLTVNGVTQTEPLPKAERVKIGHGADGDFNDISEATPLPVVDAAIAALQTADHADLAAVLTQLTSLTTADHADLAAVLTALGPAATQTTLAAILAAGAGDVANTLTDGRKTVAAPGTAVALRASLPCKWVQVTALTTNTQQVNVGGSGVLATSGASTGTPLAAGQSTTIPVNDIAKVFVDARVANEGVSFTVAS